MKKLVSVLIALLCIISVLSPAAFGADEKEASALYTEAADEQSETPENPQEPDEPDEPAQEEQYVARMCICVRLVVTGHAWIYIENLTDDTLRIGCYDCPKGQGVTLGTFFFVRVDGGGTYYNVESYMGNKKSLKRTKSNSMLLTQEQLDVVNEKILKTNEWTPFTNCCLFATKVWNSVADEHVAYGLFPFITAISISSNGNEGVPEMYVPERDQVFKQKKKKDKAYLKPVSDASLIKGIG